MKELQILSPDGKSRMVPLDGDRLCLGRATSVELSYPNDSGLSRQHTLLEREGDTWFASDLGSKNGTMLNGQPLTAKTLLKSGDRIMAGHLILICDGMASRTSEPVVVFDSSDSEYGEASSTTVITNLDSIMRADEKARAEAKGESSGLASAQMAALIRAGNELSGNRPLPELFRFILELS